MSDVALVAVSTGRGVRASRSSHCSRCSAAEEADFAELSEAAREAFIAMEGRWSVRVRELGPQRAEVLRVLRDLSGQSASQVLAALRSGSPIKEGALVEVEVFAEALKAFGVEVTLERVG